MRASRLIVRFLQVVGTLLLFAPGIGTTLLLLGVFWDVWAGHPVPLPKSIQATLAQAVLYSGVYGYLFLLAGVFVHWAVARAANVYSRWAWGVVFLASVLACANYPVGTVVGAYVLLRLFNSETFQRMRRGEEITSVSAAGNGVQDPKLDGALS